ncbi:MAG: diacylglycerol/lipid kinase family protein [Chthonomonadales bacterium]
MKQPEEPPEPQAEPQQERRGAALTAAALDGGVAVILNPKAGGGRAVRVRKKLERLLHEHAGATPWTLMETRTKGHARTLAAEAAAQGASVVAAGGGDGTCGEVVNGIAGTRARLGILPLGTGNDLARDLGLCGSLDFAVSTLFHGRPRIIDLGRVDGWFFANGAGSGFDAMVAQRVGQGYRWLRGSPAYVAAVLHSLRTFRAAAFTMEIDGHVLSLKAMLCYVANSRSTGGGMRIAPSARMDDGLLDLCIVKEVGRGEFLKAFPKVFRGTHIHHPKVLMMQARDVWLSTDPPLPVLADGDVLQNTPCRFTAVPAALEVVVP